MYIIKPQTGPTESTTSSGNDLPPDCQGYHRRENHPPASHEKRSRRFLTRRYGSFTQADTGRDSGAVEAGVGHDHKIELSPKVILLKKTSPSLRATSSINRGGAGDSSRKQGVFQLSLCL